MAIQSDGGRFFAECSGCADTEELEAETFADAVREVREMGWAIRQIRGEWIHICGSCEEELS